MNSKVKIYKIACYANILSILIFLGIVIIDFGAKNSTPFSNEDLLGFLILFLILAVYAGNFYYGFILLSRYNKEFSPLKHNNNIRIIFFILEILLAIVYTIFVYYTLNQVKWNNIWPVNDYISLSRFIVLVCLFTGYLSSLTRLFLTPLLVKAVRLKDNLTIEQFGKERL